MGLLDSFSGFQRKTDQFAGPFQEGIGITSPGLDELAVQFKAGGLKSKLSSSGIKVKSNAERRGLVSSISDEFLSTAGQLEGQRDLLRPGFSSFREAGLANIRNAKQSQVSNLRDDLARRSVLGSSFGRDAITRTEAEFARAEADFAAEATLKEIEAFVGLTEQIGQQRVQSFTTKLNELNLQADIALTLQGRAAQSLTAATIQRQQNAQAFAGQAMSLGAAAAGACEIARAAYGPFNPKWLIFARWLESAPAFFRNWYLRNQYRVAAWLKPRPWARAVVRKAMDWITHG